MKLIKVNGVFFTVESLNYCICNSLDEVDSMSIYSPVQTATLGTVSSVDIIKLRIKKDAAIAVIKVISSCKEFISHTNIMRAALLSQELGIKREDLKLLSPIS